MDTGKARENDSLGNTSSYLTISRVTHMKRLREYPTSLKHYNSLFKGTSLLLLILGRV